MGGRAVTCLLGENAMPHNFLRRFSRAIFARALCARTFIGGIAAFSGAIAVMELSAPPASAQNAPPVSAPSVPFRLEEATIADVHRAIRARQVTATEIVEEYLQRIATFNG